MLPSEEKELPLVAGKGNYTDFAVLFIYSNVFRGKKTVIVLRSR